MFFQIRRGGAGLMSAWPVWRIGLGFQAGFDACEACVNLSCRNNFPSLATDLIVIRIRPTHTCEAHTSLHRPGWSSVGPVKAAAKATLWNQSCKSFLKLNLDWAQIFHIRWSWCDVKQRLIDRSPALMKYSTLIYWPTSQRHYHNHF